MHGDAGSSDATPFAGPGIGRVTATPVFLGAACPTLLQGGDGMIVALCTAIAGQVPTVHLLDPRTADSLAQLPLAKGSLLGGVYAFLDNADRLVAVDGNRTLVRVGHSRGADGRWRLGIDSSTGLTAAIPASDAVTGLAPDWHGNVWFATGAGVVGAVDKSGMARAIELPAGEQVQNSISTSPTGTAVATTHALYELRTDSTGTPEIAWRAPYDRGSARKPGSLSWGTGSTPTYFGPSTGSEYLTIVDNADDRVNVLVYRASSGELLCRRTVLTSGGPGSENSPIGVGSSVFVASTYGYPYPTVPSGAGPAVPPTAPFTGGVTRVDVDASGCHTVWDVPIRSAAVPHLSIADGNLYTVLRHGLPDTTPLDGYSYTVVDPNTGAVRASSGMPGTIVEDPLQTSALITVDGAYLQGTLTGVVGSTTACS